MAAKKSMKTKSETPKRWYDHDPLLAEVLEALRSFQEELHSQAEVFLQKISDEVGHDAIDSFYAKVRADLGDRFGRRWYDADPTVSKAVELLRIAPPEAQRKAAEAFKKGLEEKGIKLGSAASSSKP